IGNPSSNGVNRSAYNVLANSLLEFGEEQSRPIDIDNNTINASPYILWSPLRGTNGKIMV
ncbi:hypothetical protein B0J11DRAFT_448929, partial [Dendryphion nanum]